MDGRSVRSGLSPTARFGDVGKPDLSPIGRHETVTHTAEYVTTPVPAADLAAGDLLVHPHPAENNAVHKVTAVEAKSTHVVIHSMSQETGTPRMHVALPHHLITKIVVGGAALAAVVGGGSVGEAFKRDEDAPDSPPVVTQVVQAPGHAPSSAPTGHVVAPTSASGYATAFAKIDPDEWGAADVAISVPLKDGRSVWLFGDTMSTGRFCHSSAITQTGGYFHVSRKGAQLLPDDDATHIYWIQSGRVQKDSELLVTARSMIIGHNGPWDFRDNGYSRTALVSVSKTGDLSFEKWVSKIECPPPDPGPLYNFGDGNIHHFGYGRVVHPELKLQGGKVLVTTCQNWDDEISNHLNPDGSIRFTDYQPVFSQTG